MTALVLAAGRDPGTVLAVLLAGAIVFAAAGAKPDDDKKDKP